MNKGIKNIRGKNIVSGGNKSKKVVFCLYSFSKEVKIIFASFLVKMIINSSTSMIICINLCYDHPIFSSLNGNNRVWLESSFLSSLLFGFIL